jgi:hypothetical protein
MPNPTPVDDARMFAAVFLPAGISERGGHVVYKANVKEIITEPLPAEEASSSSSGADVQATGGPCFEMFLAVCVCESGGGGGSLKRHLQLQRAHALDMLACTQPG